MRTRNRQTGTLIYTGSADDFGLDDGGGDTRWYNICDAHGSCVGHRTRTLALAFSASPIDWCEPCAEFYRSKK